MPWLQRPCHALRLRPDAIRGHLDDLPATVISRMVRLFMAVRAFSQLEPFSGDKGRKVSDAAGVASPLFL